MDAIDLPDKRAPGLPDEPYSAYCKVCWRRVYGSWVSNEPHGGACHEGATKMQDCTEAMAMARLSGEVRKYLKQHGK